MDTVFGLIGAGGYGREVMPLVQYSLQRQGLSKSVTIYFVESEPTQKMINGFPVISLDSFIDLEVADKYFNIAFADGIGREKIATQLIKSGVKPLSLMHESFVNLGHSHIGEGSVFSPFSMVTANANIGCFFHANLYSYVAHDCVIGDYVTFAPNVSCNGNVHIEDFAYIGTGAILKPGTKEKPLVIGAGAVVGMGAVVTKSVGTGATVIGNPAKPL